jgi:hypothetical protein
VVSKIINIVSVVLLLAALAAFAAARPIPATVEQETKLVSYEHEGRFDYTIHLKPSYLYGPAPVEPPAPPEAVSYPSQIVNDIAMSFTYEGTAGTAGRAEIKAVLENPGIWSKTVTLVPASSKSGSFTINFPFDIAAFDKIYDTIDSEIKINSFSRRVTIVATFTVGTSTFIQSLPVEIRENLIVIDGDLFQSQGGATGRFDYTLSLKDNSLYDTGALRAPAVVVYKAPVSTAILKPGQTVFTSMIDSMETSFNYQFRSDNQVNKVTSDVQVSAKLRAAGAEDAEIWSRDFPLMTATRSGAFTVSFPLDLDGYLDLLDKIRKETGTSAESNSIIVTAQVHTMADTAAGPVDETFTQTLTGVLKGTTIEWDKELTKNQPDAIVSSQTVANPARYLRMSAGTVKSLTGILLVIFSLLFLAVLVWRFMFRPKTAAAEIEAARTHKKYGERMAEASGPMPAAWEQMVALGSIEDLVKVADELGKPVIHYKPDAGGPHSYCVFDGTTHYRYIVTAAEK